MIRVRAFTPDQFLVFATEQGIVKKTMLSDYENIRTSGLIAIKIEEGDRLIGVKLTDGKSEMMLTTRGGMSIRFREEELRDQGRSTVGVYGIDLDKDDIVVGVEVVEANATMLCISEHGYGKRSSFDDYPVQRRGGKGVITMKASERNGALVAAHSVHEHDALMIITQKGVMIRMPVDGIRVIGRNTQGVRLINLDEGDKVVSATTVEPEDEGGEDEAAGTAPVPGTAPMA
jgi:DNA gyrase subunit A